MKSFHAEKHGLNSKIQRLRLKALLSQIAMLNYQVMFIPELLNRLRQTPRAYAFDLADDVCVFPHLRAPLVAPWNRLVLRCDQQQTPERRALRKAFRRTDFRFWQSLPGF